MYRVLFSITIKIEFSILIWSDEKGGNFILLIIYSLEIFTTVLADGLSQEFEWQHVSSNLQDSSQYSGRSQ